MPSKLQEALTAYAAGPLIPKVIDPVLLELQRRASPLVRTIPMVKWNTDVYNFNQRTAVASGGFVPDGGARPVSNSTYVQLAYQMKHVESVGAVTGYAEEVTADVIGSLRQTEIRGSIEGYYWDIEAGCLWGNAASTLNGAQPQFDGFDTLCSDFTTGYKNSLDKAGSTLTLAMLDEVADMVQTNMSAPCFSNGWMWLMSSTAASKVAQLQTSQQRFINQIEVATGLIVDSYKNIPIVISSFLASRGQAMSTVTPSTATTGGTLAAATYFYKVSPVIARQGEVMPSVEVSQTTSGSTSVVILSFTPPTGLDGASAINYKVYRSTATGTETFLGYVDATVGVASDNVTPIITNQIVDTGAVLVPQNQTGPTIPAVLPVQYFGTNVNMFPNEVGSAPTETIYLVSRDKNNLCRPYVREARPLDVYPTTSAPDVLPYAVIGDTTLAVRAARFMGRASRISLSL